MPEPLAAIGGARLYLGDALEVIRYLDEQPDVWITSPPYQLDMEYEGERDLYEYLVWCQAWIEALFDEAKEGARLCLNVPLDTSKHGQQPAYADFVEMARQVGWEYRTTIVWNEQNVSRRTAWGSFASPSAPYVTAPVEMIPVFCKGPWRRGKAGTPTISRAEFIEHTNGVWTFGGENPKRVGHPAPFPEELPRRLIQLFSFREDLIGDPFLGSGTTCAVAEKLGRRSIGIDNHAPYLEVAAERVRKATREPLAIVGRDGATYTEQRLPEAI
jgi:site-specific DNA-methyltransferase (adenine-specific)